MNQYGNGFSSGRSGMKSENNIRIINVAVDRDALISGMDKQPANVTFATART
jgi:hypothetical protein